MDVFVARQPILDVNKSIFAYELLFRSGPENFFPDFDPDAAVSRVISDSASVFGLDTLTAGRRAFINFTRQVLLDELFCILPKDWVVIELLESVEPDDDVIAACKALKRHGYLLALDDFVDRPEFEPLIELADFLKIDFQETDRRERHELAERYGSRTQLLAEKVETYDEVQEGLSLGFQYFQGYFFCQPEIIVRREVPGFKLNYLRFLQEIRRPEMDLDKLEQVIKQEVSLAVRLLRFLNSAAFGYDGRVGSIRDALVLLGERPMRKWATMIALEKVSEDKPRELTVTCLIRARLCELLAPAAGLDEEAHDLFLIGMFSLVDALVGRPVADLLDELAISPVIQTGLLDDDSHHGRVRRLAIAQEHGDWDEVASLSADLGVSNEALTAAYTQAIAWAGEIFQR